MRLRVLGCSGAEFPGQHPSAFLLDETLLLDAGTIGAVLDEQEQLRISDILISHAHLDHVRGIPLLADNIIVRGSTNSVNVIATGDILGAIHRHVLNNVIWPDFTRIPSVESAVLRFREIAPEATFSAAGFQVAAFRVNHSVPSVGYRITKGDTTIIYTGDTGPTERIWKAAGRISALLVEVSFPDDMEETALMTGHLTPSLLARELAKLKEAPPRILVTHLKPQYRERIGAELGRLHAAGMEILCDGAVYEL